MPYTFDKKAQALLPHYAHFNVANRLLFTGHSHQAWPDVALEGQTEYFHASAELIDKKWDVAFEKTEILRSYLRKYYDDPDGLYCREESTHFLFVSLMSAWDLVNKPKIITTEGEYYSLSRQLARLSEVGLEVVKIPASVDESFVDNIRKNLDSKTSAVMISRVYFQSSLINPHLTEIAALCRQHGVPLVIDDYHGTNVVPLSIRNEGLEDAFILIGGYKYLQWGEANCFLRFPKDCTIRPVITGWFASFSSLQKKQDFTKAVEFDLGNQRFASGTYDPSSQFRAAKVVQFFKKQSLEPEVLRKGYLEQIGLLKSLFLKQDIDPSILRLTHNEDIHLNGGFLSLESPHAVAIRKRLLEKDVFTDARDTILRLGPAPYTTSQQINEVIGILSETLKEMKF
jgi:kynureninase